MLLGAAGLLIAGLLWVGSANSGHAPDQGNVLAVVGMSSLISAVLTAFGFFGARATFACALLGLLLGLVHMIYVALTAHEGMADLAAFASFMLYGVIGLGVGLLLDIGRWLGGRRAQS